MPYYISSTNYTISESTYKTKGKVFNTSIRVMRLDGTIIQKRFKGYPSKAALKQAVGAFITKECEVISRAAMRNRADEAKKVATAPLKDYIALYMTSLTNQNKQATVYDKSRIYKTYIIPTLGDIPADALTKETLYNWQDGIWNATNSKGEPLSHKYLVKIKSYFAAFLSWLETRYSFPNHLPEVPTPKRRAPKTQMKFWTREQFDAFLSAVDNPMYAALFATLFFTGRRRGEVLALTPEDVSPSEITFSKSFNRYTTDGSRYTINSTKAEKIYKSPVCAPLAKTLAAYTPQSPFFFGGDDPVPPTTLQRAFDRYTTAAHLPPIRIHDLRHSFVSMIVHLGANLAVVADLIGDTLEQVTKTYAHLYESDKRAIIEAIK